MAVMLLASAADSRPVETGARPTVAAGSGGYAATYLADASGAKSRPQPTVYVTIPGKHVELEDAVASGEVSMSVIGDDKTTTHVQLHLANQTEQFIHMTIPLGQVLVPADPAYQYMMVVEPVRETLEPGGTTAVRLPTVCISTKTAKPPGIASSYSLGPHPDALHQKTCMLLVQTAHRLARTKAYDEVPIAPERRANTIAQLAIWMHQDERSRNPGDRITRRTIVSDLLRSAGKSRRSLDPTERQAIDEFGDKVFNAIDLTRKEALKLLPLNPQ